MHSTAEKLTYEFKLPDLPYEMDALEPHICKETLEYHYGKHHRGYVKKLNNLVKDSELTDMSLEDIVRTTSGKMFDNAAQVWNHTFYWDCMSPKGGGEPGGELAESIKSAFGSAQDFREQFKKKALANFGSGWTWLVKREDGTLDIVNTGDADTPLRKGIAPLLTCDVWEHAYYIDYRNERNRYLDAFFEIINWNFVAHNFEKAE